MKQVTYLASGGNSESKTCPFCAKKNIWKFDLFHLTLAWPPSKINFDDVIGSDAHHYRYLRVKWPRKRVSLGMFVTFIFCDLLWPDLNLFRYNLCTHVLSFSDISQHFVWVWALELFAALLTDPTLENVKTVFFTFDLTLTLHMTFIVKC